MTDHCRDWGKTLWPASLNGIPFIWESDDGEGGRESVDHMHVGAGYIIEDTSQSVGTFSVEGLFNGDSADAEYNAFEAMALLLDGPCLLTLPVTGPVTVMFDKISRQTSKDELGAVRFSLSVKRVLEEGAPGLPLGASINLVLSALSQGAALIDTLFKSQAFAPMPNDLSGTLKDLVSDFGGGLALLRQNVPLPEKQAAIARAKISDFHAFGLDMLNGAKAPITGAYLPAFFDEMLDALLDGSNAKDSLKELLEAFSGIPAPSYEGVETTARWHYWLLQASLSLRASFLYADAIFASREEALVARDEHHAFMRPLLEQLDHSDLRNALTNVQAQAYAHQARALTELAPVVRIEVPASMPVTYWALRFYRRVETRADEMALRNQIPHPAFMPQNFEARTK